MRTYLGVSVASVLLVVTACGDSSSGSNGEITSQEDVQQFFQTIMPDLIEALTDLAGELPSATSSSTIEKGGSETSTVSCPGGGALDVNLNTGEATLSNCTVGGVTISASLFLNVYGTQGLYTATFSGTLNVSGSFTGTVVVTDALVQWMVPSDRLNTSWDITVLVNGQSYTVSDGPDGTDGTCGAGCGIPSDFSGTWTGTYECTFRTAECGGTFGGDITFEVEQDGCSATYSDGEASYPGRVCGDVFTFDGGGPGFTESGTLTLVTPNTARKESIFVNTDGGCTGDCNDNLFRP